jgi:hypothetical protein
MHALTRRANLNYGPTGLQALGYFNYQSKSVD